MNKTMAFPEYPKWFRDILQLLPVRSQFLLSGNIRDLVELVTHDKPVFPGLHDALWHGLSRLGYEGLLVWDEVEGLRCHPPNIKTSWRNNLFGHNLTGSALPLPTLNTVAALMRNVQNASSQKGTQPSPPPIALVIDYASRLGNRQESEKTVMKFFAAAEKTALDARPLARSDRIELFNPVFWLASREQDLPDWLTADNERVHSLRIPLPGSDTREHAARWQAQRLGVPEPEIGVFVENLAHLTDNLSINAIRDIISIARRCDLPAARIADAVEIHRIGDTEGDNPWRAENLHRHILEAESGADRNIHLSNRIRGQAKAVTKVLDILKRTSIGLTGAQTRGSASRPRGVLFFAGPTGVGKTEMAKAIAKIVFGDDSAYKRFDMSEFSAEHSGDRLIGAPPGYVGFDQGGELTNAMRERPFRVLLFDEIEKAHERILDKFLQILEDGRLTDGRGQTVYFSDALIVFTSNAGIIERKNDGTVRFLVNSELSESNPAEYEKTVLKGVGDYFRNRLERPELLNRMGENIVVFSFITKEVGYEILETFLDNVRQHTKKEHGFTLVIAEQAMNKLRVLCVDSDLSMGGRGIGSKVESVLVNPLARLLFSNIPEANRTLNITDIVDENNDGIWELTSNAD